MYSLPNPAISVTGQDSQVETMCTSSLVQVHRGHKILSVSVSQILIDGQHQHEQGHTFKRLSVRTK